MQLSGLHLLYQLAEPNMKLNPSLLNCIIQNVELQHIFEFMRYGLVGSFSLFTYLLFSIGLHELGSSAWLAVAVAYFLA